MGKTERQLEDDVNSEFVTVPGRPGGLPRGLANRAALIGKVPVPESKATAPSGGFANDNNGNVDLNSFNAGDELPDGTIYVGKRKDGQHLVTTPKVLPRMAKHQTALETHKLMLGQSVSDHGHSDWILPDLEEGRMLYKTKDKGKFKGTYEKSQFSDGHQFVWLSEVHAVNRNYAWYQWFDDGGQFNDRPRVTEFSVRPVRRCNHLVI